MRNVEFQRENREEGKRETSSFMQKLRESKAMRWFKIGVAALMIESATASTVEKRGVPPEQDTRSASVDVKAKEKEISEKAAELISGWSVGAKQHLFEKDPATGEWNFEWKNLLAPISISASHERPDEKGFHADVPYVYSRKFDTGQPLNDENDYEQTSDSLEAQTKDDMKEAIHAFLYKAEYETGAETFNPEITDLQVKGFASPEARTEISPQPGVIDSENLQLAGLRAESAKNLLIKSAGEKGITLDSAAVPVVESDEIQFSESEMDTLMTMAEKYFPGEDSVKQLYDLLVKYNDNAIPDAEDAQTMHTIVNEKRKIVIDAEVKGKAKDTYVIPLPVLLALLLPFLRRRRRDEKLTSNELEQPDQKLVGRDRVEAPTKITDEKTLTGSTTSSETLVTEESVVVEKTKLSGDLKKIAEIQKLEARRGAIKREFEEQKYYLEVMLDVNTSFGFYEPILEKYQRLDLNNEKLLAEHVTRDILDAWTKNDNELRARVGEGALNHEENGRQVLYAMLHAEALIGLLKMKETNPHYKYSVLWEEPETQKEIQRRVSERFKEL